MTAIHWLLVIEGSAVSVPLPLFLSVVVCFISVCVSYICIYIYIYIYIYYICTYILYILSHFLSLSPSLSLSVLSFFSPCVCLSLFLSELIFFHSLYLSVCLCLLVWYLARLLICSVFIYLPLVLRQLKQLLCLLKALNFIALSPTSSEKNALQLLISLSSFRCTYNPAPPLPSA